MSNKTLQNIFEKYSGINCGIIEESQENNCLLKAILIGGLYSVTRITGCCRNIEKSFLLVFDYRNIGNLQETLIKLVKKFRLESAVYNNVSAHECYILGTSTVIKENLYSPENQGIMPELGQYTFNQEVSNEYHAFDDTLLDYNHSSKQLYRREYYKICD